jgi:hypothetical protein
LPAHVQRKADKKFELLKSNPAHPSLRFKKVTDDLGSVRVGLSYRVLATRSDDAMLWFWIGHHSDYDEILKGR